MKWRSGTFSGTTILNEPYIISTTYLAVNLLGHCFLVVLDRLALMFD